MQSLLCFSETHFVPIFITRGQASLQFRESCSAVSLWQCGKTDHRQTKVMDEKVHVYLSECETDRMTKSSVSVELMNTLIE